MSDLLNVILLTFATGLAMPLGALLAKFEHFQSDWLEQEFRHSIMAFGAGALLSAIALVLVPEGMKALSPVVACSWFIGGAAVFMLLDIWLSKNQTSASQLMAMLADFLPESLALGAAVAAGGSQALLLGALIALQNIPEGFNAYRELRQFSTYSGWVIVASFTAMACFGPLAGLAGYFWLAESPALVAMIMLFAAGGILYSLFQDIAPQVRLEQHWAPPMGAIAGFVTGMLGYMYH